LDDISGTAVFGYWHLSWRDVKLLRYRPIAVVKLEWR